MILSTRSSQTLSRGQEFSANHSSRGCRPYDLNNIVKMGSIVANVNDIYATVKQRKFIMESKDRGFNSMSSSFGANFTT
ncbi:hypothetical protein YC2023_008541 [Brassica napus]